MPRLPEQDTGEGPRPPACRPSSLDVSAGAGGLGALRLPWWAFVLLGGVGMLWVGARWRRGRPVLTLVAWLLVAASVGGVSAVRMDAIRTSVVADLAA